MGGNGYSIEAFQQICDLAQGVVRRSCLHLSAFLFPSFSLVRELLIDYFVYHLNRELTCGTLYGHLGEVKLTVCRGSGRRRRPEGGDMDINDPALAVGPDKA